MLGLGHEVLRKIQNLLVQVDKNKNKNNQRETQPISKSKSKTKLEHQKHPKPPHKKHKSFFQLEEKQNICSHRIQQLYLNHFVKEKRLLDRNLANIEQQMKELKNFKVQNKTSQFLNQKQQFKPIHQRTPEILKRKQRSIQKIKHAVPKSKQELQQQEAQLIIEQHKRKYPKLTKQEFQKKMKEMQQRNFLRMQKLQKKKLKQISQRSVLLTEKPQLNIMTSKVWWQKKKLKKNLSTNVFQRFSQYDLQKKEKWEKYLQKRKIQETPFTPRISQATKQIVRKSISRKSLIEEIPRSHSCRALSKREESYFGQRRQGESTDRSLSRNLTHGKSVATMSSSRPALLEKRFN